MDRRRFLQTGVAGAAALLAGGIDPASLLAKTPPKKKHPLPPLTYDDHELLLAYLMRNISTYGPLFTPDEPDVGRKWLAQANDTWPTNVRYAARNVFDTYGAAPKPQPIPKPTRDAYQHVLAEFNKAQTLDDFSVTLDVLTKDPSLRRIPAMAIGLTGASEIFELGRDTIYNSKADPYGYYNETISRAFKRGDLKGPQGGSEEKKAKSGLWKAVVIADLAGAVGNALAAGSGYGFDAAFGSGQPPTTTTNSSSRSDKAKDITKNAISGAVGASATVVIYKWLKYKGP